MKVREPDIGKMALFARFLNHVPEEGDLLVILLKGHLMVEEQLYAAASKKLENSDFLEKMNLRFVQLMNLVRAQYATPPDYWLWEAITLLNKARNELAHQIEPSNIANLVRDFLKKVDLDSSVFKSKEEELHMAIAMVASLIYELYRNNT